MIEAIATADFVDQFAGTSAAVASSDLFAVFLYEGDGPPRCLHHNFDEGEGRRGLSNYLSQTYRLNPFFDAHARGIRPGVYRIGDLVAAKPRRRQPLDLPIVITAEEEIGYITEGWPPSMAELDVAVPLDRRTTCEVSLLRDRRHDFAEPDIAALAALYPIMASAFGKHWQLCRERGLGLTAAPADRQEDEDPLGPLTPREREVVAMIVEGYCSEAIGRHLEVSLETVKTHRKRAYAKLRISSQAELFSLILAHERGSAARLTRGGLRPQ